jgi:hypothetical protein
VNGKIYVIGGNTMQFDSLNVTEVYDPATNSWATKASAPLAVGSYASAVVDNKIYILGTDPNLNVYPQRILLVYDPVMDTWTIKGKAPTSFAPTAAVTTGTNALKRIYYFDANQTDIYDPASNTWVTGTPAPITYRKIAAATTLDDDSIYLIGGRSGEWGYMVFMYPSNVTERYLPVGYGAPDTSEPTGIPMASPDLTAVPSTTLAEGTPIASEPMQQEPETYPQLPIIPIVAALIVLAVVGMGIAFWRKTKRSTKVKMS